MRELVDKIKSMSNEQTTKGTQTMTNNKTKNGNSFKMMSDIEDGKWFNRYRGYEIRSIYHATEETSWTKVTKYRDAYGRIKSRKREITSRKLIGCTITKGSYSHELECEENWSFICKSHIDRLIHTK